MVGQSRPGASAEINADIETMRLNRKRKNLLGVSRQLCHFEKLFVGCLVEIGNMPGRRNEQMPVVIREVIHYRDAVFGMPQDKILVVILRSFDIFANEALVLVGKTLYIPYPPRSPKILSFQLFTPPIDY